MRSPKHLAPVVQTLDSAIHRINQYPADKYYGNQYYYTIRRTVIYLVDSAIQRYPTTRARTLPS